MTFSLLARDDTTGRLGVATATHAFGAGPLADHTRPGVAVIATQSFVEISYGPRGLDLIEGGASPAEALDKLLAEDPDREIRQVAYLDVQGAIAHHTGSRCVPSCGSVVRGPVIAIGNMLASDDVLPAMLDGFHESGGELEDQLLAGLRAGDQAGGDARGRMSAALRVVAAEPAAEQWQGTLVDLRVDLDADPIARLDDALRTHRAYGIFFQSVFAPGLVTGDEAVTGDALERALVGLGETRDALGGDPEPTAWQGVLLLRAGREDEGCARLAEAIAARPQLRRFADGLAEIGTIPFGGDEILRRAAQ